MYLTNTRVWLNKLRETRGESITLKDITDDEINLLCKGQDAVWFMGIYRPSAVSEDLAKRYGRDVSSPFSITAYEPNSLLAHDWSEWDEFVRRVHERGVKVLLDFVPNHLARDHPWTKMHPEYFIHNDDGSIAYGKDPNFPSGWADTAQLDYSNPELEGEMQAILLEIARHADGVRCDMAMLIEPDTFQRTWGKSVPRFWVDAIGKVRKIKPNFIFIAESYGGIDQLLNAGFDGVYDSEYYENLQKLIKGVISKTDFINHLKVMDKHAVVYLENHDESRAVLKFGGREKANALAVITAFSPALWMVHQGQEEGRREHLDMQVDHFPINETLDYETNKLYEFLLILRQAKLFRNGVWSYPDLIGAENIIAQQVEADKSGIIACTNFSDINSAGFIRLPVGAKNVRVFDINDQRFIDNPSIPQRLDDRREELYLYLDLDPNRSQIIYYEL